MDDLFAELARIRHEAPDSSTAQAAMDKMYSHFNSNFGFSYSLEAFAGIGQMYVSDDRFTVNIDKYGSGLSLFLSEAMSIYAKNKR
jgi:hypothetical protein